MVVGFTNYLCNQSLSPIKLWVRIPLMARSTRCTIVLKFVSGRWFFLGTLVSSTNKTDCHDITDLLLKVALNTITLYLTHYLVLKINTNYLKTKQILSSFFRIEQILLGSLPEMKVRLCPKLSTTWELRQIKLRYNKVNNLIL